MAFYCPRLANGLAFTANGDYDVCGVRNLSTSSKISTASMSPAEFKQSPYYLNIQEQMSNGQWPRGCEHCQWKESIGLSSSRQHAIELNTTTVHVHTTNVCDSDCIMCGPRWSTTIAKRLAKFPDLRSAYFTTGYEAEKIWSSDAATNNLKLAIENANHLNIVGGEPLLDKRMWKFLAQIKRPDLMVSFVTNGNTRLSKPQLKTLAGFKKVKMTFSVDATGQLYEWIREGLSWSTLLKNIVYAKTLDIEITATAVAQAHNVLNLIELENTFKRFNIPISFDPLTHPALLNMCNAPKWAIEKALDECTLNTSLYRILSLAYNSKPLFDPQVLEAHTVYLNQHRTHKFDTRTWNINHYG